MSCKSCNGDIYDLLCNAVKMVSPEGTVSIKKVGCTFKIDTVAGANTAKEVQRAYKLVAEAGVSSYFITELYHGELIDVLIEGFPIDDNDFVELSDNIVLQKGKLKFNIELEEGQRITVYYKK